MIFRVKTRFTEFRLPENVKRLRQAERKAKVALHACYSGSSDVEATNKAWERYQAARQATVSYFREANKTR